VIESLQSHFLFDLAEAADGEIEVFLRVAGGDLRADAVASFRNDRIAETDDIHALFEHTACKFLRGLRIVQHNGDDGMLAGEQIEAELFHLRTEIARVLMNLVAQRRGFLQQVDRADCRGADGGSQRIGEKVRARTLPQQVDDRLTRCGIAAGRTAHGLAERAGDDVDASNDTAELCRAAAVRAHEADGVAVVDHRQRVIAVGEIADGLEVCNIAIHGEHAVGRDQNFLAAGFPRVLELGFKVFHVVVQIAVALGLAQAHAVDDGRVVQLIRNDRVLRPKQRLKQTAVGVEAGGIEDGVVGACELCDAALELLVDLLRAADEAHRRKAEAPAVIAGLRGLDEPRVVGQAKIVVGTHVDDVGFLRGVDAGALRGGDDALFAPGTGFADRVQLLFKGFQCSFHDKSSLLRPIKNHLAGPAAHHCVKALLEVCVVEAVRNDRRQIESALHHVRHLVPVVHLAAIDALQRQAVCNDLVHVHADGAVAETKQRDLAAAAHDGDQLVERRGVSGHFKTYVKALGQALLVHDLAQILLCGVDGGVDTHLSGKVEPVFVDIGDDDAACARVFADAARDNADGARAGDEHVLADEREHERGMRGVAEGVKEGDNVLRQALVDGNDVARRDADILRERAVPVDADADMVLTPLNIAGVTVAAVAAGDMALAGDALADREARDARAKLGDLADILMADDLWGLDVLLRPLVPFVDMDVGAADRGLVDLDENFSGARHRNRHLPQLQSGAGCGFYDGIHHLIHL